MLQKLRSRIPNERGATVIRNTRVVGDFLTSLNPGSTANLEIYAKSPLEKFLSPFLFGVTYYETE